MVGALRDRDVREEAGTVLPLLDDLRRSWCGDYAASAATTKNLLNMLVSNELRRYELPDEGALPGAHRNEVRSTAGRAPAELGGDFVIDPQSLSLGFGLGPRLARGLGFLG